ncbi:MULTISPECIES: hypothetical protein [unclassified Nostoc]|uniref:hypothetical protein n=1 Tax=unclassified Nostoc TaxID=2593658 RepID=UPI0026101271|nr:hypothetical protein [Nostoc sp. S13]MDF5739951.1 hypothetical protein [Nostoc sp. S13]
MMSLFLDFLMKDAMQNPSKLVPYTQEMSDEMDDLLAEVRIFPLLKLDGELSPYIESVIETFSSHGFDVKVQPVAYEFQKGGNQMLKIITCVSG